MSLEDRTIVVTGAAQGIGQATINLALELGANCVAVDLNADGLATYDRSNTRIMTLTGSVTDEAHQVVTDVFAPDGERQDDGDVDREPTAENGVVVEGDNVSPELADAAAAEVNAAEQGDAATASLHAPGGESAPDPR